MTLNPTIFNTISKRLTEISFFLIFISVFHNSEAQSACSNPGQTPSTAFPVCGTSTFTQTIVPLCDGQIVASPSCSSDPLKDVNPYYYKFTCFQAGTLGFLITPKDLGDDYDWELCDITNKDPDLIYTDANLVVASNWSGEPGVTGASSAGSKQYVCAGFGQPLFSRMPVLQANHNYLLLVSHFTLTQSGYDLNFVGGNAVITDTTSPHLKSATSICGGSIIRIKLNKRMRCASLASDGSDFSVFPGNMSIASVNGFGCSSGFDLDSLEIHMNGTMAPGNYKLSVKNGTDGNTLLDICGSGIPVNESIDFTVFPLLPEPMDSVEPVKCSPRQLWLHFKNPIDCSSVADNGSDFTITGPYPVSISKAYGNCSNTNFSNEIVLNIQQPLRTQGRFTITLNKGSDGNTIKNECGLETPEGSQLSFNVFSTVDASFSYQIIYGCSQDTIKVSNNGVTYMYWDLDDGQHATTASATGIYSIFNSKKITLKVSNGVCSDSSSQIVSLDNYLHADFTVFEDNCPNEPVSFIGNAQGKVKSYLWNFGDGSTSTDTSPVHKYSSPTINTPFRINFSVTDSFGCTQSKQKIITIYSSCYLAVPNAFTPNHDGKNDYLHPLNAIKADQLDFKVYNRWGQLVFETKDWKKGWDGTYNGKDQPSGVYIWFLHFKDRDSGQIRESKGTTILIR